MEGSDRESIINHAIRHIKGEHSHLGHVQTDTLGDTMRDLYAIQENIISLENLGNNTDKCFLKTEPSTKTNNVPLQPGESSSKTVLIHTHIDLDNNKTGKVSLNGRATLDRGDSRNGGRFCESGTASFNIKY